MIHCFESADGLRVFIESGPYKTLLEFSPLDFDVQGFLFYYWNSEREYWNYVAAKSNGYLVPSPEDQKIVGRRTLFAAAARLDQAPGVSIKHAATFLGVNRRTISRMVAHGRLEKLPGNRGVSIRTLMALALETYIPAANFDWSENLLGHMGQ
jgi:hypothetical protein